jgi:hypothetical protein
VGVVSDKEDCGIGLYFMFPLGASSWMFFEEGNYFSLETVGVMSIFYSNILLKPSYREDTLIKKFRAWMGI